MDVLEAAENIEESPIPGRSCRSRAALELVLTAFQEAAKNIEGPPVPGLSCRSRAAQELVLTAFVGKSSLGRSKKQAGALNEKCLGSATQA